MSLHPVLHGFSYSPREAGFPGWVRFGSWFNEQNPWWPHVRRFTDYAARLTTVLSSSEFQANVALLGPRADEWARDGLLYQPFPEVSRPWYHYHLWQALQQAGYGTDFVSEGVLRGARVEGGRIAYGARAYDTLLLMDVVSLEPETAEAIARFGEAGGRVVFVGRKPERAPGLKDAPEADRRVKEAVARLLLSRAGRAVVVPRPVAGPRAAGRRTRGACCPTEPGARCCAGRSCHAAARSGAAARRRTWRRRTKTWASSTTARATARSSSSRTRAGPRARDFEARFPTGDRRPWRWDLETGTRAPMPFSAQPDTLALHLEPLESLLLVFEPVIPRDPGSACHSEGPRLPACHSEGPRLDGSRGIRSSRAAELLGVTGRGPPAPAGTGCRSSRRGRWRSAPRAERPSTAASPSSST